MHSMFSFFSDGHKVILTPGVNPGSVDLRITENESDQEVTVTLDRDRVADLLKALNVLAE